MPTIFFFQKIDADMIGIGPFIPHPDTPLKDAEGGTLQMALKVMALTRLLLPDINIPATTAMETLVPEGQTKSPAIRRQCFDAEHHPHLLPAILRAVSRQNDNRIYA